jgi:site-specific recombinase XerD
MLLSKMVTEYKEYQVRMKALSELSTLRNYLMLIREFVRWIDAAEGRPSTASDLTPALFVRYVDHIAARVPKKAHMMRAAVRSFCRYLIRTKSIEADITKDIDLPTVERSVRVGPDEDIIDKLLSAVETIQVSERRRHLYRAALYLLVFAGLRKKEVYDLRVEDIRLSEREVFVRYGKGNSPRTVKCPDEFWPVMEDYLAQRPAHPSPRLLVYSDGYAVGIGCASKVLRNVMAAAGLSEESITPHCLRHTFATRAAGNNAPLTVIQAQLGHSKVTTTAGYIHAPKKISEQEAAFFGKRNADPVYVPAPRPAPQPDSAERPARTSPAARSAGDWRQAAREARCVRVVRRAA